MAKTQEFDYYHSEESNDFRFIRVPRQLMTDPRFRDLSSEAKLLYSLLLDRMSLSAKNGWWDEQHRVFIYFTVKEIQEIFSCSKNKAIWLLEELDTAKGVGLIERVRQGQGKPAKIYVKKFTTAENSDGLQKSELLTSQNETSGGSISENQEVKKQDSNYTDKNYTERINQSIYQRKRSFETPGIGLMDRLIISTVISNALEKDHSPPRQLCIGSRAGRRSLDKPNCVGPASTSFVKQMTLVKNKKTVHNPPEQWVTFSDTHQAIIDRETWDIVRKIREQRHRPTKMGEMGMFSGLAFCADCGARLYHCRSTTMEYRQEWYTCSNYRNRKGCSAHYIRAVVLERLVLQNLQRVLSYAQEDEEAFAYRLMENSQAAKSAEREQAKRELERQKRRDGELDFIIQRLYEDMISGRITEGRFEKLSSAYEQEQGELKQAMAGLEETIQKGQRQETDIQSFLKLVRKYTAPTELTPAMLREFVEKIVVHAPDKSSGHRVQQIDIYYNFIGENDFSPEYSKKATA